MRVVLVSDTYAPRLGGIEVQVAGLARALRTAGHDVQVVTATAGEPEPGLHRVPGPGGAVPNPLSRNRVRDLLCDADLVHAHMGVLSPFAQAAVGDAVALGVPVVVTVHSVVAAAGLALRPLLRSWARAGVVLTACSPVAAAHVERRCCTMVLVMPNGIDAARWAPPAGRPHGAGQDGRVVAVCATRLAARKRPVPLLRALARVPAGDRPRLVLAGDGPQAGLVRTAVDRYGLHDDVRLAGRVAPPRLREILWGADVFVSPVRLEAFGVAALEARCAGLPVVGYRTSGVSGLVDDGRTGLLVDGDTGLTDALARLACDRALLAALRAGSAADPPGFGWDRAVARVEELAALARPR